MSRVPAGPVVDLGATARAREAHKNQVEMGRVQVYDSHFRAVVGACVQLHGGASISATDLEHIVSDADRITRAAIEKVQTFAAERGIELK